MYLIFIFGKKSIYHVPNQNFSALKSFCFIIKFNYNLIKYDKSSKLTFDTKIPGF